MVSEFNEKIFRKLFELIAPIELKQNCALLVMGSEGRGEQIIKSDQDNALILSDEVHVDEKILKDFVSEFIAILEELGYPKCQGKIMMDNPFWAKSLSEFKKSIREWIDYPTGENVLNFSIFYDAKCVAGDGRLLDELKKEIQKNTQSTLHFFTSFAAATLSFETPLGFFTSFKLDKSDQLDIKKGGIFAIVHGVRTIALENNIEELNTIKRILKIKQVGIFDEKFASELIEAFNYLCTLRLKVSDRKSTRLNSSHI